MCIRDRTSADAMSALVNLGYGRAEAHAALQKARAAGEGPGQSSAAAAPAATSASHAADIFKALDARLADKPALKDEIRANVTFVVGDVTWSVDAGGDTASTFTIADEDLTALVREESSARDLFQRGKLRVDGDLSVAHRLGFLKGLI